MRLSKLHVILIPFVLFIFNKSNNGFAQKKRNNDNSLSAQQSNELYFKKNVAPIFKSSCTCHQGITDYAQALPKAQKILEVVKHPDGKMSTNLKKDYYPIVEYWVKTISVKN